MTYFNSEIKTLSLYAKNRSWQLYFLQLYKIIHRAKLLTDEIAFDLFLFELIIKVTEDLGLKQFDDLILTESGRFGNKDADHNKILRSIFQKTKVKIKDLENYVYFFIGDSFEPQIKINNSEMLENGLQFSYGDLKNISPFYREGEFDEHKVFVLVHQAFKDFSEIDLVGMDVTISYLLNRIKLVKKEKTAIINIKRTENYNPKLLKEYIRTIIVGIIEMILEGDLSIDQIIFDCESDKDRKLSNSILNEITNILCSDNNLDLSIDLLFQSIGLDPNKNDTLVSKSSDDPSIELRKKFSLYSTKMDKDFRLLYQIKDKDYSIIFLGESGSGKEYLARLIHSESNRSNNEFVVINCANVQKELLNSELFGHKKGAFTGAISEKEGLVKKAENGTLFLDEIGDAPLDVQAALLTFLQKKEFRKVGGTKVEKANVRIIFATNQNLENLVQKKLFRDDLYYRIMKYPINVMPLRERLEDMPDLVDSIKANWEAEFKIKLIISDGFIKKLQTNNWPGNIRELNNVLERIFTLAEGEKERIIEAHLFNPSSILDGDYQTTFQLTDYENSTLEFFKIWLLHRERISAELKSQPQLIDEEDGSNLLSFGRSIIEPILANVYVNNWEALGIGAQTKSGKTIGLTWGSKTGTLPKRHKLYPIVKKFFG